jgi:hypothetical protein
MKKKKIIIIVTGDFNAKSAAWGGTKSDKRDAILMNMLFKKGLLPIKIKQK